MCNEMNTDDYKEIREEIYKLFSKYIPQYENESAFDYCLRTNEFMKLSPHAKKYKITGKEALKYVDLIGE